nr:site-specific integrase [Rubellimicrobium aerolatum]
MPELPSPELLDVTLGELERLSGLVHLSARDLWDYRDTFIVALLLACPIRLRNLTMMELGRHLVQQGDEWHLRFEPHETKTGQPIHLILPAALDPYLEAYLSRIRPAYRGADTHNRVWVAQKGRPMAYETIYSRVTMATARLFETTLSPHAFRTLAATLLAETSPEDSLHTRPLLGHRQFATTEQFYIRASQLRAAQNVSQALLAIRDGEEALKPEETE